MYLHRLQAQHKSARVTGSGQPTWEYSASMHLPVLPSLCGVQPKPEVQCAFWSPWAPSWAKDLPEPADSPRVTSSQKYNALSAVVRPRTSRKLAG